MPAPPTPTKCSRRPFQLAWGAVRSVRERGLASRVVLRRHWPTSRPNEPSQKMPGVATSLRCSAAMTLRRVLATAIAATGVLAAAVLGAAAARPRSGTPHARIALEQQCPDHHSSHRDPANPLDLPVPPGPNPL